MVLLASAMMLGTTANGQGCAQCRDNVRSTPPAVQRAYRQAIGLLGGTALALCSLAVVVMRRNSR